MAEYDVGDRVRIDIPNEANPNHDQYHGKHGTIINILGDDADTLCKDESDSSIYRIHLDEGKKLDVRYLAIRPPIE